MKKWAVVAIIVVVVVAGLSLAASQGMRRLGCVVTSNDGEHSDGKREDCEDIGITAACARHGSGHCGDGQGGRGQEVPVCILLEGGGRADDGDEEGLRGGDGQGVRSGGRDRGPNHRSGGEGNRG